MPWVLVTGAARGLGRAIALQLANQGHNVVIHYNLSQKEGEETAALCRERGVFSETIQGDLSLPTAFIQSYCERFEETFGIVNNIGNYLIKPLTQTSEREWHSLFQTNVYAPLFLINALLPSIKAHQGRIVNIGTAGIHSQRTNTYCPAYEISKSTLWHFTLNLAKEIAPDHVTVNMVSPGIMTTSIDREEKKMLIPMKIFCAPEKVAYSVGFLFKKESSYITGQNIEVAGGFGL